MQQNVQTLPATPGQEAASKGAAEMFMFATGIENSSPTIGHGRVRIDEMDSCGHYMKWRLDFDKVQELDIRFLRYGVPLYKVYLGPNLFDWSFSDEVFADLRRRG